jgi:DNA mismatch endonuclease (patch repair protein)
VNRVRKQRPIRTPSFAGFRPSSAASSRAKQANLSRNTLPELCLRRALWRLGLRYRTHWQKLPGRPDIVFPRARLAIFCDGDFWHGRNWAQLRPVLQRRANPLYWVAKIAANRARDERTRRAIRRRGWQVMRLWETEIRRDPALIARHLRKVVLARVRALGPSRSGSEISEPTNSPQRRGSLKQTTSLPQSLKLDGSHV